MPTMVPASLLRYGINSALEVYKLPAKDQKKVVFEIAKYLVQRIPELIIEVSTHAKANRVVDIVTWGLDGDPNVALYVGSIRLEDSLFSLALTLEGKIVIGSLLKDPNEDYNKRMGLSKKITQMEISMIMDDIVKTPVTSFENEIDFTFPITLSSFFYLAENISEIANKAGVARTDWRPVKELSVLGSNIHPGLL